MATRSTPTPPSCSGPGAPGGSRPRRGAGVLPLRPDLRFPRRAAGRTRVTRRGFLGLVELRPFSDRVVLPHERTLSGPKEDRLKLFCATETNLSPGFMLYRDPGRSLDAPLAEGSVLAQFTSPDGVEHALGKVTRPAALRAVVDGIARSALLIADGHHRYETALRYCQHVAGTRPDAVPDGEHRFFMTFLANGDDPDFVSSRRTATSTRCRRSRSTI